MLNPSSIENIEVDSVNNLDCVSPTNIESGELLHSPIHSALQINPA